MRLLITLHQLIPATEGDGDGPTRLFETPPFNPPTCQVRHAHGAWSTVDGRAMFTDLVSLDQDNRHARITWLMPA